MIEKISGRDRSQHEMVVHHILEALKGRVGLNSHRKEVPQMGQMKNKREKVCSF